jgi:hypothetical protein
VGVGSADSLKVNKNRFCFFGSQQPGIHSHIRLKESFVGHDASWQTQQEEDEGVPPLQAQ